MSSWPLLLAALLVAPLLLACDGGQPAPSESVPTTPPPLTDEQLRNATYSIEAATQPVHLKDGFFRSNDIVPTETRLLDVQAFGRLDADDSIDAVVLLASQLGGSGTFIELIAVLNEDGQPHPVAGDFLGDRVPVRSIEVVNRQIIVELSVHTMDDPLCCPTLEATRVYELTGSELTLVSQTP
jgi:hypothetical protein